MSQSSLKTLKKRLYAFYPNIFDFNIRFFKLLRVSGLLICKCARFYIKHASQNVVFIKGTLTRDILAFFNIFNIKSVFFSVC